MKPNWKTQQMLNEALEATMSYAGDIEVANVATEELLKELVTEQQKDPSFTAARSPGEHRMVQEFKELSRHVAWGGS